MELTIEQINYIMENDFKIPTEFSLMEITPLLIEKLGSINSDLREGSLEILFSWITNGEYDDKTLISLGDKVSSLLHEGVGQDNTDSVFLRAFAALEVAGILAFDVQCINGEIEGRGAFLTLKIVRRWFNTALEYYRQEIDYRSYVNEKGWAHSIAHGADLFKNFAKHPLIQKEEILQILRTFQHKLRSPSSIIFNGKEELRITSAVYTCLLRNKLDIQEIKNWISSIVEPFRGKKFWEFTKDIEKLNSYFHVERFLKDFYLMIKFGISRKGLQAQSYYDDPLQNRKEILQMLKNCILELDSNSFYHKPEKE